MQYALLSKPLVDIVISNIPARESLGGQYILFLCASVAFRHEKNIFFIALHSVRCIHMASGVLVTFKDVSRLCQYQYPSVYVHSKRKYSHRIKNTI